MSQLSANPTPRPGARPILGVLAAFTLVSALPALADRGFDRSFAPLVRLGAWLWLMVAPGLVIGWLIRVEDRVAGLMVALLLSPVVLSLAAVVGIMLGSDPRTVAAVLVVATLAAGVVARRRRSPRASSPVPRGGAMALAALVLLVVGLTAALPLTREWWRVRSDAWFHAAVVAQIRDYGLPAEDPYFVGMPLQYMWFYHAMVLTLGETLRLDAFWIMALANAQAVAGLALAGWSLAGVFRAGAAHRFTAAATLLFGFNAAFWVLLPVKALKAMVGDVRGVEELARTYALSPFDYQTACKFMNIYSNQEFFLDKFMVATAFGFALAFMTAAWFALADYLARPRPAPLVVLALALVGMLGFHSLVGFVMLVGIFGGVILAGLFRRSVDALRPRPLVGLLLVSLGCFVLLAPYLHQVMHMKERAQVIPIDFSLAKTAGIFISSALVLLMALRGRALFGDRSPAARVFLFGTLAVTAFCVSIRLPGPNTVDKLGYFVFIPLSILGGFAIADAILARSGRARVKAAAAWALLFAAPVNGLAIAASFHTPDETAVSAAELRLAAWVREHTGRDAVFIDDHDRVFLLVTGPRRYYWGWWAYAQQWGYPRPEMARRYHVRRSVYAPAPLDAGVLSSLAAVAEPLFVIARPEHRAAGAAVVTSPGLIDLVYDGGDIALYRVDPSACRAAAGIARPAPSPEELLLESGL